MGFVPEIDTERFDDAVVANSKSKVTVVDIWAPWCGPCRVLSPILDDLAKEFGEKVQFYKLNADDNGDVVVRYGVRSIPTLLLFKDGKVVDRKTGADDKSRIRSFITQHVA